MRLLRGEGDGNVTDLIKWVARDSTDNTFALGHVAI